MAVPRRRIKMANLSNQPATETLNADQKIADEALKRFPRRPIREILLPVRRER
jgi:hypothetical protein